MCSEKCPESCKHNLYHKFETNLEFSILSLNCANTSVYHPRATFFLKSSLKRIKLKVCCLANRYRKQDCSRQPQQVLLAHQLPLYIATQATVHYLDHLRERVTFKDDFSNVIMRHVKISFYYFSLVITNARILLITSCLLMETFFSTCLSSNSIGWKNY